MEFFSFYAFERYSERLYETMEQNIVIIKQKKDLEYYMQISEIDKKQKELIHNITNQVKMIHVFAKDGNTKAILELTDSIGEEMEKDSRIGRRVHHEITQITKKIKNG